MTIKPHEAFDIIRPDEVAECWNGVFSAGNLYEELWNCVEHYDDSYRESIEDMGPHDVIGLNTVAQFWDKFSPENQTKLNELAVAQDAAIKALMGRGE